jgi:hypothetical protein
MMAHMILTQAIIWFARRGAPNFLWCTDPYTEPAD